MLKPILASFYEMIDIARLEFGNDAGRITEDIIRRAFPETWAASEMEGAAAMFREGVLEAVKRYIRKPDADTRQLILGSMPPRLVDHAKRLTSTAYYVPRLARHVTLDELVKAPQDLKAAGEYLRTKGRECFEEAKRIFELHDAVVMA